MPNIFSNLFRDSSANLVDDRKTTIAAWDASAVEETNSTRAQETVRAGIVDQASESDVGQAAAAPESSLAQTCGLPDDNSGAKNEIDIRTATALPRDLKTAIKLWQQACELPEVTKEERIFKSERKAWISPHVAALQNGPPAPEITSEHLAARKAHQLSAPAARAARLEKLRSALDGTHFDTAPIVLSTKVQPIIRDAILACVDDAGSITSTIAGHARRELAEYETLFLENFPQIHPETRADEIKIQLLNSTDLDEISRLQSELHLVTGLGSKQVNAARQNLIATRFGTVQTAVKCLNHEVLEKVKEFKAAAVLSEQSFFDRHGVERHETAASRRYDAVLAELENRRGAEPAGHGNRVPNPNHSGLEYFGVEVLPE